LKSVYFSCGDLGGDVRSTGIAEEARGASLAEPLPCYVQEPASFSAETSPSVKIRLMLAADASSLFEPAV